MKKSRRKKNKAKIERMLDLGASIREKLDKRGWNSNVFGPETFDRMSNSEWGRTEGEVISKMREFIALWEEVNR